MRPLRISVSLLLVLLGACIRSAELPHEPGRVAGYLMLHGSGELSPAALEAFVKFSGGPKAVIVYVAQGDGSDPYPKIEVPGVFQKCGAASVRLLTLRHADDANNAELIASVRNATGVWLAPWNSNAEFAKSITGTALEKELRALSKRDGVLGVSGAMATLFGQAMIRSENDKTDIVKGLGFLPGGVVDVLTAHRTGNEALLAALKHRPELVGFGIEPGGTLLARGRNLVAIGAPIHVCVAASATRTAREEVLPPNRGGSPERWPADLVALQRAAMARMQPAFPPAKMAPPEVPIGTLVIDGGGIPKDALLRFIEAAGGPDALIVAFPTAMSDTPPANPSEARMLQRAGAKNVKVFHLAERADAFDEEKIKILREAKGIWFCGGRQWRYVDVYLDSPAEKLMHEVLSRGGAIGGSSAGATIQGEYLVRGNPLGNMQMMAEGYERGFGFLKGVAIDQHFVKRNRFADMTAFKKAFPQVLGLGIDEGAALVVTGHTLEVVGLGQVCIYDVRQPAEGQPDYVAVKSGEKFDLSTLKK